MHGGSSSAVHAVDVERARGRHRLVLRRFTLPGWQSPELAAREAHVLGLLKGFALPVPEVIAFDAQAEYCDAPALLMTRLPGRIDLRPRDMQPWLRRLAEPLPAIHALRVPYGAVQPYAPFYQPPEIKTPEWSAHPEAWAELHNIVSRPRPSSDNVFIHRDYHPGNILWSRGRTSGILDWINASIGPAAIDVGHCRINLVCLYGVPVADEFLDAYLLLSGASRAGWHPYWDAIALADSSSAAGENLFPGWERIGPRDLTLDLMRRRLDEYAASIAERS